jgi:hypothetical protein
MLPEDPEATILKQLKGIPGTGEPAALPDADPSAAPGAPPAEGSGTPPAEPAPGDTGYRPTDQQELQRLQDATKTPPN